MWHAGVPHTRTEFSAKHFLTLVTGQFDDYEVSPEYDREKPEQGSVRVCVDVVSVNTGDEEHDAHLMSGDFLGAERYSGTRTSPSNLSSCFGPVRANSWYEAHSPPRIRHVRFTSPFRPSA
jgi:hypothetical protein